MQDDFIALLIVEINYFSELYFKSPNLEINRDPKQKIVLIIHFDMAIKGINTNAERTGQTVFGTVAQDKIMELVVRGHSALCILSTTNAKLVEELLTEKMRMKHQIRWTTY